MNKCKTCGKFLSKESTYCSSNCQQRRSKTVRKKRIIKEKLLLIEKAGGKCALCGYNKNIAALTFHHTRDKLFKLSMRNIKRKSKKCVRNEAKKCILLCQNCHAEVHNPHLNYDKLLKELHDS